MKKTQGRSAPTSGVDWLTLTIDESDSAYRDTCRDWESFVQLSKYLGHDLKAWGASGYQGYSCGGRAVGYREGGAILRVSGESANEALDAQYKRACGVPRIDLHLTGFSSDEDPNAVIERIYRSVKESIHSGAIKTQRCSLVSENGGGMTCYVGSRTSEVFLRIYNKFAESGEQRYFKHIRYEAEFKGKQARKVAGLLARIPRDRRPVTIGATVAREFKSRAVEIVVPHNEVEYLIYSNDKEKTDFERQLAWLENQVAPTVAKLIKAGYTFEVLEAIGIPRLEWSDLLGVDKPEQTV